MQQIGDIGAATAWGLVNVASQETQGMMWHDGLAAFSAPASIPEEAAGLLRTLLLAASH